MPVSDFSSTRTLFSMNLRATPRYRRYRAGLYTTHEDKRRFCRALCPDILLQHQSDEATSCEPVETYRCTIFWTSPVPH